MDGPVRRVVTGVDDNGKAVFLADEEVDLDTFSNSPPGTGIVKIWGSNERPSFPSTDVAFEYDRVFPPPEGFRYNIWRVMPDSARGDLVPLDPEVLGAEMDEKFPGMRETFEPGGDGMHTTDSIDIGVILDGEIWLELDDGAERRLSAGDVFVQTGTRHRWHNRTDSVCTMASVLIGGMRQ